MKQPGLCECGCGQRTRLAPYDCPRDGWVKGRPLRFVRGHTWRLRTVRAYKHGERFFGRGRYIMLLRPEHPRADSSGYVAEHVLVAEKALGHLLPDGSVVHHVNENKQENSGNNLVICQDQGYHMLLHSRLRALKACGNPLWRKCKYCKKYDDPSNMHFQYDRDGYSHGHHMECARRDTANRERNKCVKLS